jgi:hypothetical protein
MGDSARCVRCGRVISIGFYTEFIRWRFTPDGQGVCPHCLTPAETVNHGTPVMTDSPDELLRALDPDNDAEDDKELG